MPLKKGAEGNQSAHMAPIRNGETAGKQIAAGAKVQVPTTFEQHPTTPMVTFDQMQALGRGCRLFGFMVKRKLSATGVTGPNDTVNSALQKEHMTMVVDTASTVHMIAPQHAWRMARLRHTNLYMSI